MQLHAPRAVLARRILDILVPLDSRAEPAGGLEIERPFEGLVERDACADVRRLRIEGERVVHRGVEHGEVERAVGRVREDVVLAAGGRGSVGLEIDGRVDTAANVKDVCSY